MATELKKIKVTKISIVSAGANREQFMLRKSVDFEEDEIDIGDFFPLQIPEHLIQKQEEEEELEDLRKAEREEAGADPDDPFPSIPIFSPAPLLDEEEIKKNADPDDPMPTLSMLLKAVHQQVHPEQYEDDEDPEED